MPLDHEGLLDGILDALDLELLATDGTTKEALHDSGGDGNGRGLILGREGVIAGDVTVGLEGALHCQTNALLVEGFAAAVALANGEFTALKRVDAAQGELSGEWFHGFGERFWGFWEKVHKTLYIVSRGASCRNL